jgi:uncharacterized membrane-anchored protein
MNRPLLQSQPNAGTATRSGEAQSLHPVMRAFRKVPEVTIYFWIIKLLTTAMGEATSDYMVHNLDPVIAVGLGAIGLAIALVLQFAVRRYIAWIYWLAALMVALFGTMAADVFNRGLAFVLHTGTNLSVPYLISTIFFTVALAVVFAVWYATEKTLSIHSISTFRRELFYWAVVLITFALGTATGDMSAITLHLGYLASGILFAIVIAVPALGFKLFGLNEILAFWFAYIITRPIGASFADWFGRSTDLGGIGLDMGLVCLVLGFLIVIFVAYMTITRKDVIKEE